MKKIISVVVAVLIILVVAGLLFLRRTPFAYSGVVEAVEVDVPSRLSDTISEITVQEGSAVQKGEVLARLDCRDPRLKAAIAQKEVKSADTRLKTTRPPYTKAGATLPAPFRARCCTNTTNPGNLSRPAANC